MSNHLEDALLDIVQKWEARSELYTNEGDCAASLADIARIALNRRTHNVTRTNTG